MTVLLMNLATRWQIQRRLLHDGGLF